VSIGAGGGVLPGPFQDTLKTSLCALQHRQRNDCGFAVSEEAIVECRRALFPTAEGPEKGQATPHLAKCSQGRSPGILPLRDPA